MCVFGENFANDGKTVGAGHEYDNVTLAQARTSADAELPAELTLFPENIFRRYDANMFGVCQDNVLTDCSHLCIVPPNADYPAPNPDFVALLKGQKIPLNRFWFLRNLWDKCVGPLHQRPAVSLAVEFAPSVCLGGIKEILDATLAIDEQAGFVVTVPVHDTEQCRLAAEYLCGSSVSEWGAKRAAAGHPEPYEIALWELANEADWTPGEQLTIDEYIPLCRQAMAAVRSICPQARFAAHAATAPWHETQEAHWKEWHRRVLRDLAMDIDYLAFHAYYHGHTIAKIETYLQVMFDDMASSVNSNIRMFISEHGVWPNGEPDQPWEKFWYKTHCLSGCIYVAEWFNRMFAHPEITMMTMHNLSSGPWGEVYADEKSGKLYSTALTDLFRLYQSIPETGRVIAHRLSGDGTAFDDDLTLTALAVQSEDASSLWLVFSNALPNTARRVKVNLDGWHPVSAQVLSGPDMASCNSATQRHIVVTSDDSVIENEKTLLLPPRSVALIHYEK